MRLEKDFFFVRLFWQNHVQWGSTVVREKTERRWFYKWPLFFLWTYFIDDVWRLLLRDDQSQSQPRREDMIRLTSSDVHASRYFMIIHPMDSYIYHNLYFLRLLLYIQVKWTNSFIHLYILTTQHIEYKVCQLIFKGSTQVRTVVDCQGLSIRI